VAISRLPRRYAPRNDIATNMKKIYFDHSATTPIDKKVLDAILPYFSDIYGNANSIHAFGQEALAGVDQAREQVAKFLNCDPGEIIFTSGATESDNLAIKGVVKALRQKGLQKMHIITTKVEHEAVLEPCRELEKEGVEVTYLPVQKNCLVDVKKLETAIKDETVLVSVMYVNSEVGAIEPIREIAIIIKKINEKRLRDWEKRRPAERGEKPQPIYFHTDATQAINFCNCDVQWNFIDLLSLSAHKIYGPKGVGALYIRKNVPLVSLQKGGHHERNLRSGTLNVAGIVGLGAAIAQIDKMHQEKNNIKLNKLRKILIAGLLKNVPNSILNTDLDHSAPSHAHFTFPGAEGESILISLDLEGIAVSTGSACAAGSLEPSHVLLAMGIPAEIAHSSIRFTLGKENTEAEIKRVIKVLPPIIKRLRKMNPIYK
jgi:cysteine desulfurase